MAELNALERAAPPWRIAVAQIGARRHYAVPVLLHEAGLLEQLFTDLCSAAGVVRLLEAVVPSRCRPRRLKQLLGRRAQGIPAAKIQCFPRFALKWFIKQRGVRDPARKLAGWRKANAEFGRLVANRGLGEANGVYVFNAAGLEILEHARRGGLKTIVDQTTAPFAVEETLLAEERDRWPGWEFDGTRPEDWRPMAQREEAEWRLADAIVCGSEFVRQGVLAAGGPAEKCAVVPYGVPSANVRHVPRAPRSGPLRVLFVGTVCLRKGIQYLVQAASELGPNVAVFRVVGPVNVTDCALDEIRKSVELVGPVPRSAIGDEYEWADVLVMPSISEGSANVCYEAMAAGLPVITTPNAGSVVRDGHEGYVIPIRRADLIVDRLLRLVGDRSLWAALSENALARAREYSWSDYSARLIETIQAAFTRSVN